MAAPSQRLQQEPGYSLTSTRPQLRKEYKASAAEFEQSNREVGGSRARGALVCVSKLVTQRRPTSGQSVISAPRAVHDQNRATAAAAATAADTAKLPGANAAAASQHESSALASSGAISSQALFFGVQRNPLDRVHASVRIAAKIEAHSTSWAALLAFHTAALRLVRTEQFERARERKCAPGSPAAAAALTFADKTRIAAARDHTRTHAHAVNSMVGSKSALLTRDFDIAELCNALPPASTSSFTGSAVTGKRQQQQQLLLVSPTRSATAAATAAVEPPQQPIQWNSPRIRHSKGAFSGPAHCPIRTLRCYTEGSGGAVGALPVSPPAATSAVHLHSISDVIALARASRTSHDDASNPATAAAAARPPIAARNPYYRTRTQAEFGDILDGGGYLPNLWASLSWQQRQLTVSTPAGESTGLIGDAGAAQQHLFSRSSPVNSDVLDRDTFLLGLRNGLAALALPRLQEEVWRRLVLASMPRSMSHFDRAYQRYRVAWDSNEHQAQLQQWQQPMLPSRGGTYRNSEGGDDDDDATDEQQQWPQLSPRGPLMGEPTTPAVALPAATWFPSSIRGDEHTDPRFDPMQGQQQQQLLQLTTHRGVTTPAHAGRPSSNRGRSGIDDYTGFDTGRSRDSSRGSSRGTARGLTPATSSRSPSRDSRSSRNESGRPSRGTSPSRAGKAGGLAAPKLNFSDPTVIDALTRLWEAEFAPVAAAAEELASAWSVAHPVFAATSANGPLQQAGIEWRHLLSALRVVAEPLAFPHQHMRRAMALALAPLSASSVSALTPPPPPQLYVERTRLATSFPRDCHVMGAVAAAAAGISAAAAAAVAGTPSAALHCNNSPLIPRSPPRLHWPATIEEEGAAAAERGDFLQRAAGAYPCTWAPVLTESNYQSTDDDGDGGGGVDGAAWVAGRGMRLGDCLRLLSSLCTDATASGTLQEAVLAGMRQIDAAAGTRGPPPESAVISLPAFDALLSSSALLGMTAPAPSVTAGGELLRYGSLARIEATLPFGPRGHLPSSRARFAEHAGTVLAEWAYARALGGRVLAGWRLFAQQRRLMKRVLAGWRAAQTRFCGAPALLIWAKVTREEIAARRIQRLYWEARRRATQRLLAGVRVMQRAWRRYVARVLRPKQSAAARAAALAVLTPPLRGWLERRRLVAVVSAQWRAVEALRERRAHIARNLQMVKVAHVITRAARGFLARRAARIQLQGLHVERERAHTRSAAAAARATRHSIDARLERAAVRRQLWLVQLRSRITSARKEAAEAKQKAAAASAARIRTEVEGLNIRLVAERERIQLEYARAEGDSMRAQPYRATLLRTLVPSFLTDILVRGAGLAAVAAASDTLTAVAPTSAELMRGGGRGDKSGVSSGAAGAAAGARKAFAAATSAAADRIADIMSHEGPGAGGVTTSPALGLVLQPNGAMVTAGGKSRVSTALHEAADILRFHDELTEPPWHKILDDAAIPERRTDAPPSSSSGALFDAPCVIGWDAVHNRCKNALTHATRRRGLLTEVAQRHGLTTKLLSASKAAAAAAKNRGRRGSEEPTSGGGGSGGSDTNKRGKRHSMPPPTSASSGAAAGAGVTVAVGDASADGRRGSGGRGGGLIGAVNGWLRGRRNSASGPSSRRGSGGGSRGGESRADSTSSAAQPTSPIAPGSTRQGSVATTGSGLAGFSLPRRRMSSPSPVRKGISAALLTPTSAVVVTADSITRTRAALSEHDDDGNTFTRTSAASVGTEGATELNTPGGGEGGSADTVCTGPLAATLGGPNASFMKNVAATIEGLQLHEHERRRSFALASYGSSAGGMVHTGGSAGSMDSLGSLRRANSGLFADSVNGGGASSVGSGVYPQMQLRSGLASSNGGDVGSGFARLGSFVNPYAGGAQTGGGGAGGSSLLRSSSAASLLAAAAATNEARTGREEDKLTSLAAGLLQYVAGALASAEKASKKQKPPGGGGGGAQGKAVKFAAATGTKKGGGDDNDNAPAAAAAAAAPAEDAPAVVPTDEDLDHLVRKILSRSPFLRDLVEDGVASIERRTVELRRKLAMMAFATFDVDRRAPTLEGDARCRALTEWLTTSSEIVRAAVTEALDVCDMDRAQTLAAKVHLAVESHLAGMRVPFEEAGARRMQTAWRTQHARAFARRRALRVYVRVRAPEFASSYVFNRRLGTSHWLVPWFVERLGVTMGELTELETTTVPVGVDVDTEAHVGAEVVVDAHVPVGVDEHMPVGVDADGGDDGGGEEAVAAVEEGVRGEGIGQRWISSSSSSSADLPVDVSY